MKVIRLTEAKSRLSHYGRVCRKEPVVVTVNGVPAFELVPLAETDDLVDELIQQNPRFQKLLAGRRKGKKISAIEALKRI
jgi:prevent-host-death family protein